LLHAGAAAAGLTLVAAHHVFLLDVFATPGQELQALNRCHRIGQPHAVTCRTYYCERTVEERMLALRELEGEGAAARGPHDGEDESVAVLNGGGGGGALPSPDARANSPLLNARFAPNLTPYH